MQVPSFCFLCMVLFPLELQWVLIKATAFLSFHMDATMFPFLQKTDSPRRSDFTSGLLAFKPLGKSVLLAHVVPQRQSLSDSQSLASQTEVKKLLLTRLQTTQCPRPFSGWPPSFLPVQTCIVLTKPFVASAGTHFTGFMGMYCLKPSLPLYLTIPLSVETNFDG